MELIFATLFILFGLFYDEISPKKKKRRYTEETPLTDKENYILSKLNYNTYMQSQEWKNISQTFKTAAGKCTDCGTTKDLVLHHLRYKNLGYELEYPEDVVVLCSTCHNYRHSTLPAIVDYKSYISFEDTTKAKYKGNPNE